MRTILIDGKEYKFEFYFEAAMNQDFVSKVYKLVSGAYIIADQIGGAANSVAAIPELCLTAFHAGLLENDNTVDLAKAKALMVTYMKDHKLNFVGLWRELQEDMENDGFFDLTGIKEMLNKTLEIMEEVTEKSAEELNQQTTPKKKKSSTTVK